MKSSISIKFVVIIILFPLTLFSQDESWQIFMNSESVLDMIVYDEKVWCATNGGIVAVDKENYSLEHFNSANSSLQYAGVPSCSFITDSYLLFSNKGLHVFDGTNWSVYDEQNSVLPSDVGISCISKGYNETCLLGMQNGEVYRFDGNTIEYVTDLCLSQQFLESVLDIYEDSSNSLWACGELGLCHYSNGGSIVYTSSNSDMSHSSVTAIDKDSTGNLWIGTYGGGVNMFDGVNWTIYNMFDIGLLSNRVISIHVDSQNSVWVGTEGGLGRFQNNQWTAFTTQASDITGNVILSIESDTDNTIYIGTSFNSVSYTGLNIFKNGEWNAISLSNSTIGSNSISDIEKSNNNDVLVASGSNLSKYNVSGWERFQVPLFNPFPYNTVHDIEFDSENIPWVLLENGIAKFENENFSLYDHIGNTGGYSYLPRTLGIDATDRKWMGTDDEGVYIFDGTSWSNINISNSPLISNQVNDIERDLNDDMWIACGSSGGLYQIENNNWTHYHNQNTELPQNTSNWVWEIEIDQNNNKYLGTHSLCIFDDPFASWTIYNTSNSDLPQIDVGAIAVEEDGTLWIGTGNGLAKLVAGQWTIYNQSNSPITNNAITDILIDNNNNKWIGTVNGLLLLSDNIINSTEYPEKKDLIFNIEPNPSTGIFRITNNGNHNYATIEIYSSIGTPIISKKYQRLPSSIYVEMDNVSTGVYYCKISTDDTIEVHNIVVSK